MTLALCFAAGLLLGYGWGCYQRRRTMRRIGELTRAANRCVLSDQLRSRL